MNKDSRILIVGHNDIVESSLTAHFQKNGYTQIFVASGLPLDVCNQSAVDHFFKKEQPEYIFLGSTRSGGIEANQKRGAEFIYHNLAGQTHIIEASRHYRVKKLLYFGSSCVYPKQSPQPIKTEFLLTGHLEPTSEPYAMAKIAGIKMCQAYRKQYGFSAIVAVPATVYGPGMEKDEAGSHVLGALMHKIHGAVKEGKKEIVLWGTGSPRREFIFSEDFAAAAHFLMEQYNGEDVIHIGCGYDVSIKELAEKSAAAAGFAGEIKFDTAKPDGAMQKLLDSSSIQALGWKPEVSLEDGIAKTYQWYKQTKDY